MRIHNSLLPCLIEEIDNLYVVTTRIEAKYDGIIPKNCLAIFRPKTSKKDYKEFWCVDFKRTGMFGSFNYFDLTYYFKSGLVRPLNKDEKYEILLKYAKHNIKKSITVRKKIRKLLEAAQ